MIIGVAVLIYAIMCVSVSEAYAIAACRDDNGNAAYSTGFKGWYCGTLTDCVKGFTCLPNEPFTCSGSVCGKDPCPHRKYDISVSKHGNCKLGTYSQDTLKTCYHCNNPKVGTAWWVCAHGHMYVPGTGEDCFNERCSIVLLITTDKCVGEY